MNNEFSEILIFSLLFSPFILFSFILKIGSQYTVLDDLKLTMYTRLTLNFQMSSCFHLQSSEITGMYTLPR